MNKDRIEFLRAKERDIRAALAAEQLKLAKRQHRETVKLETLLGSAVHKAGALSPEFKLMIAQTALVNVTDDKARRFLTEKGWL
jgi:hypothetical protein